MKTLIVNLPQFEDALQTKLGDIFRLDNFIIQGDSVQNALRNFRAYYGLSLQNIVCIEYEHKREVFGKILQWEWKPIAGTTNWNFRIKFQRVEEPKEEKLSPLNLIQKERNRQIQEEGYSFQYDDFHEEGALARAAACYAIPQEIRDDDELISCGHGSIRKYLWPWEEQYWKPSPTTDIPSRLRELTKAGALILAEMERLQRLEQKSQ